MIFTREFQASIEQQKKPVGPGQSMISDTSDFQKYLNQEKEKLIAQILLLFQIKSNDQHLEQPGLQQADQKLPDQKQPDSNQNDLNQADSKQADLKQVESESQTIQKPCLTDYQQCRNKYSQFYFKTLQQLQRIQISAKIEHQALIYSNRIDYLNKIKQSWSDQQVQIKIQQEGRFNKLITDYVFNIKTYLSTLGDRVQVSEFLQEQGEIQEYIQRQKQEFEKYRPQIQYLIEQREEKLKQTLKYVQGGFMHKNEQIKSLKQQKKLLEQQISRERLLIKQLQDKQTNLYSEISKITLLMVQNKSSACSNINHSRLSEGEQINGQSDGQIRQFESQISEPQFNSQIIQLNSPMSNQSPLQQISRQGEQKSKQNQLKCQIQANKMQQLKKQAIAFVFLGILTLVQIFW